MRKIPIAFILLFSGFCFVPVDGAGMDEFLNDDRLQGAFVGILFEDINSDSIMFAYNDDLRFSTASNLKLFTSAAALELLGPDYCFQTDFYNSGEIKNNGKLNGDLLICGGGDPLISGRFRDTLTEVLDYWGDSLQSRGIEEIKGDLVIDNGFFKADELGPGWSWDDLTYWYACPISALSFNDNCVDFHVYPGGEADSSCRIILNPPNDYIAMLNHTQTLLEGQENTFDFYRHPGTNIVDYFGGVAIDDPEGIVDYVSVRKPDIYCATILRDILKYRNIKLKGKIIEVDTLDTLTKYHYANLKKLFTWQSEPLSVVISVINKNSQNFFAEQTLKTIGAEIAGEGSYPASTMVVEDWLESIGITADDITYCDGSGLSYIDLAKPSAIIELLDHMYSSPNFDTYFESMAIPGVDRSVRNRMKGHPLAAAMRTKTGHIANTRTFAGYLTTSQGKLVAFSLMVNNYAAGSDEIDNWMDDFCRFVIDNN